MGGLTSTEAIRTQGRRDLLPSVAILRGGFWRGTSGTRTEGAEQHKAGEERHVNSCAARRRERGRSGSRSRADSPGQLEKLNFDG